MHEMLYRYLIRYHKIDLPGIGGIALQTEPAQGDIVTQSFSSPKYSFLFDRTEDVPPERLFSWLASHLNITEQQAVIQFNDFIFDLGRQLREGKEIQWPGVGLLQKEISGEIKFTPVKKELPGTEKIVAEKVIRRNAEHTVLVGENEKSSTEINEMLRPTYREKRDYWWVWPVAIMLAIVIFLGWYFSEYGGSNAAGNRQKISPADAPSTYHLTR